MFICSFEFSFTIRKKNGRGNFSQKLFDEVGQKVSEKVYSFCSFFEEVEFLSFFIRKLVNLQEKNDGNFSVRKILRNNFDKNKSKVFIWF